MMGIHVDVGLFIHENDFCSGDRSCEAQCPPPLDLLHSRDEDLSSRCSEWLHSITCAPCYFALL